MNKNCQPKLSETLHTLKDMAAERDLRIGVLMEALGDRSFGLLLFILSLPAALPMPTFGYGIPFGLITGLIGVQMCWGNPRIWLPSCALSITITRSRAKSILRFGENLFNKIERFIHPRLLAIQSRTVRKIIGCLVVLMGVLITIPLPFTNTIPAMIICLLALGLIEQDGVWVIIAGISALLAIGCYSSLLFLIINSVTV